MCLLQKWQAHPPDKEFITMKNALKAVVFAVLFALALPLQAMAAEQAEIGLDTAGEKAQVNITLPENTGKGITALELHIQVENMADAAVAFEFSNQLNATIQQARYNEAKKELVVYVAGGKNLFVNDALFLGSVVAESDVDGQVELSIQEGALKLADGVYAVSSESVQPVQAVLQTQGSTSSEPTVPPDSSSSSSSSSSDSSSSSNVTSSSSTSTAIGGSGNQTGNTTVTASSSSKHTSSSTNKVQSSSSSKQDESSEQSESASAESSVSEQTSSSQSSASLAASQAQPTQNAQDSAVWVVVGVFVAVAVVVAAVIVIRRKNSE